MPPKSQVEQKNDSKETDSKEPKSGDTTPAQASPQGDQQPPQNQPAGTPPAPPAPQGDDGVAAELAAYKRRCLQLQGQVDAALAKLDVEKAMRKAATTELEALRARMASETKSTLPELDDDSFELIESVTIAQRGLKVAGHARKGDVVTVGDVELVQRRVGDRARVFPVTRATVDELGGLGMLLER